MARLDPALFVSSTYERNVRLGTCRGGLIDMPMPAAGSVRFRSARSSNLGVVCELDGPVLPPTGAGTHDITERKGRIGLTEYHGKAPMVLRIPVLLDRWSDRDSVEPELSVLERMRGVGTKAPPAHLIVEGHGIPFARHIDRSLRWVMDGEPEWDGDDIRTVGTKGAISYIAGVLNVLQVSELELSVQEPSQPLAATIGAELAARDYFKVPAGNRLRTLAEIAKKVNVPKRTLAKLNPKLPADPTRPLPADTSVRIS